MPTQKQHPIEIQCLFNGQKKLPYPDGVESVEKMIARNAFFPGGSGLWATPTDEEWQVLRHFQICRSFFDNPDMPPIMPVEKVMVLGYHFSPKCWHEKCLHEDEYDLNCNTWKNLLSLLKDAGIRPKDCFFTNAYMGLMEEVPSDKEFEKCCRSFLAKQIAVQKPRLILALGRDAIELIAPLSSRLKAWQDKKFKDLDKSGPLVNDVCFAGASEQPAAVIALVHPGWRSSNVGARRYRGDKGEAAELGMLTDALRISGLR